MSEIYNNLVTIMNIAIIPNSVKAEAVEYANEIIKFLSAYECDFSVPSEFSDAVQSNRAAYFRNHYETVRNADLVIAIGGDGTIIHIAKHAAVLHKPVLGVNCGRVGFVANLEPTELSLLSKLFDKSYIIDERMLLEVKVNYGNKTEILYGLNDVTISKGSISRMVEIDVKLNGEFINSYRADGIIFSTPTGSTAYSLSAGGPVIEPHMKCILLTPICPHSLFSRSVLFSDDSEVTVFPNEKCTEDIFVTVDGIHSYKIEKNDNITIRKAHLTADFIKLNNKNFYRILNDKLNERRN